MLNKLLHRIFSTLETLERWTQARHARKVLYAAGGLFAIALILLVYSWHQKMVLIDKRLESHGWSMPSTIYAQAPTLQSGKSVTPDAVVQYLNRINYSKTTRSVPKPAEYSVRPDGIAFCTKPSSGNEKDAVPVLVTFRGTRVNKIINLQTKKQVADYSLEPMPISSLFGSDLDKRTLVKYGDIPQHLIQAVVGIEDHRFFEHHGIDFVAIARAAWRNLRTDRLEGASTITQQLVKNFFLTHKRVLSRKINEAFMALMLETKLDKKEILELYLNEVYLGQNGSMNIHGVGEASRVYFGKDVKSLTVPEAALLAGMIQAPAKYNPYRHLENATGRRKEVLLAMKDSGSITQAQFDIYDKAPITLRKFDPVINKAPYFTDFVENQLSHKFSEQEIHSGNLRVYTTLDLDMQEEAQKALTDGLARIDKVRFAKTQKEVQGCLIAIEPSTGAIKAYVGGRDYSKSQYDRLILAERQPGSTFKPIVYAAAIDSGLTSDRPFTTATLIEDDPWQQQGQDVPLQQAAWQPENSDLQYHGAVSLRTALALSLNIATARLAQAVGIEKIASLATSLGFKNVKPYPSLALGTMEATPWEVIQAYTVFANAGLRIEPSAINQVSDEEGALLEQDKPNTVRVLNPQTAYIMTNMLRTVVTSGTAASMQSRGVTRPVAGKTGTSDGFRDGWFIGFTPDLICLVWVGYDDNTPINMSAAQAALPVWASFMKQALQKYPVRDFPRPAGIVVRAIDPTTGKLATATCPKVYNEVFIEGTEPLETCKDEYHYLPASYFVGPQPRGSAVYEQGSSDYPSSTEGYTYEGTELDQGQAPNEAPNEAQTQPQAQYFAAPPSNYDEVHKNEKEGKQLDERQPSYLYFAEPVPTSPQASQHQGQEQQPEGQQQIDQQEPAQDPSEDQSGSDKQPPSDQTGDQSTQDDTRPPL